MLSKEQWLEWLNHPVTRELKLVIKERQEDGHRAILMSSDPDSDRVIKGIILGLQEVVDWTPDYSQEIEDEV